MKGGRVRIGCGCVSLGSSGGSSGRQVRLVHAALDSGVTVFDTADAYGAGASEDILGRALRGRRSDVELATKGGFLFRPRSALEQHGRRFVAPGVKRIRSRRGSGGASAPSSGGYAEQDFSASHLRRALDQSLRRLRTDHVDVYQLHGPPSVLPALIGELEDLRVKGKVGRFGVGAQSPESARDWVDAGVALDVLQLPYGVLDPHTVDELGERDDDLEIWARGVLGGGVIALAMAESSDLGGHHHEATLAALGEVAAASGLALDELAIRWAAADPRLAVTLLGMSSEQHLHRNVQLLTAGPLSADVHDAVDDAIRRINSDEAGS
jgi:aryl-alcohol dehydrogenase-like predicted oxidoreductase